MGAGVGGETMLGEENRIQFACAKWLRENGYLFFHTPNEGKRTAQQGAKLIALGLQPGVHDLCVLLDGGVTVWIELKTGRGVVSQHQKNWHEKIIQKGHHSHILRAETPQQAVLTLSEILAGHSAQSR